MTELAALECSATASRRVPTRKEDHAPTWKRRRFNELWNSSGAEPPDSEHLSDRALQGIGWVQSSHWWVHFPLEFLLRLVERWKTDPDRRELVTDPWRFVDWLDEKMSENPNRPMRHTLLYRSDLRIRRGSSRYSRYVEKRRTGFTML